jgi:hypothetical protein
MTCSIKSVVGIGVMLASGLMASGNASANSYVGSDPYSTGCANSAYVINTQEIIPYIVNVQSWYSVNCNTKYATVNTYPWPAHWTAPTSVNISFPGILDNGRGSRSWFWRGPAWYYSNMISGGSFMAPCATLPMPNGGMFSNCNWLVVIK